jgi:hypothetical protein
MLVLKENKRKLFKSVERTLYSVVFTVFVASMMTSFQGISDNRSIKRGWHEKTALPDVLLEYSPNWMPHRAADILLNYLFLISFISVLVRWIFRVRRTKDFYYPSITTLRSIRRYFWCWGIAYLLRSLSVLVTALPPSDARCVYKERTFVQLLHVGYDIVSGRGNSCSDKVFSGHTSTATLLGLFWIAAFCKKTSKPLNLQNGNSTNTNAIHQKNISWLSRIGIIWIVFHVLAISAACVLCRNHYTVDVLIAIMICCSIFSIYFLNLHLIKLIDRPNLKNLNNEIEKTLNLNPSDLENTTLIKITDPSDKEELKNCFLKEEFKSQPGIMRFSMKLVSWLDGYDIFH